MPKKQIDLSGIEKAKKKQYVVFNEYDENYLNAKKEFDKSLKNVKDEDSIKQLKKVNKMVVKSKKLKEFQAGKCSGTCKVTIIAVDEPREFGSEGKILQKIMVEDDTAKQWVAVFEPDIKYKMHMKINMDGYSKLYNDEWQFAVGHKKFGGGITLLPGDYEIPKSDKPKKKVETEPKQNFNDYTLMNVIELRKIMKDKFGAEKGHIENIIMWKLQIAALDKNTEALRK